MRIIYKRLDDHSVTVFEADQLSVMDREAVEEEFRNDDTGEVMLPDDCGAILTSEIDTAGEHVALQDYGDAVTRLTEGFKNGIADFRDLCCTV